MVSIPSYYKATLRNGPEQTTVVVGKDEVFAYCSQIPDAVGPKGGPFLPSNEELLRGFRYSCFGQEVAFAPIDEGELVEMGNDWE